MRGGYSLDETHTPEIAACLIPASLRSPVITFTSARVLSLSRAASSESGTDNAPLIGNTAKPKGFLPRGSIKVNMIKLVTLLPDVTNLFFIANIMQ